MATETYAYEPNYAVMPGRILSERLEASGMTLNDVAKQWGCSTSSLGDIIVGKAPIEREIAVRLEKIVGVAAEIWLGLESDYRHQQSLHTSSQRFEESSKWARDFPFKELVKRGAVNDVSSDKDKILELLTFFGVSSPEVWRTRYGKTGVNYRHSPSFESDENSLASWLRLAEIESVRQETKDYNEELFSEALKNIRRLTTYDISEGIGFAQNYCNEAGVVLVLVKPVPKTRLSGAAWWPTPNVPIIALSARHKTDDHLWFSFFHEAAHILLHSKEDVFIDDSQRSSGNEEDEANEWATDSLVPQCIWDRFIDTNRYSSRDVKAFANELGLAPGIVVGRLQHEERIPWNRLNGLKVRLKWTDD